MSIANFEQLKDITQDLWRKAKAKIEAIANDYVSKTLPNNVNGETIFTNGHVEGTILKMFSNKNSDMLIGNGGSCFGVPSTSINAGINVGKIAMAVDPGLEVGSTVNNVVALAVKKSNNVVKEVIVQNETATVCYNTNANLNAQKIIYIDINRSFNEEVYFLIGCNKMLWNMDTPPRANAFGGPIPTVGTRLGVADYHYSGRFIIFSSRTSFEQLVSICNDSISKTKNNILSAKTILQDAYIQNGDIYSIDNQNATDEYYTSSDTTYSGTANKIIPANKNVTSIIVAVRSSMNVGAIATGINVGVVRADTNEVIEYVHQNATSTVHENSYPQINASRIVNIPINKSWEQNVYFIIGVNGMLWYSPHGSLQFDKVTGGNSLLSVGHVINNLNRTNYIGKIVVLGEVVSLNTLNDKIDISQVANEPNKIPRIGADGRLPSSILPPEQNGGVRTVNDQSPNPSGNVTVLAEHIKYANGQDTTIKQEIDKKINGSDAVISSEAGKIVKLDDNGKLNDNMLSSSVIKSNQANTFTKLNSFNGYSPTVHRLFTRKHINSHVNNNSNLATYQHNKYFAPVNEVYTDRNKRITHLLLPIRGASVGEQIAIDVFAFNNNKRLIRLGTSKKYPVIDEEIAGCKCVKITFDIDSGTNGIGFGFMIMSTGVGAVCVQGGPNVAWTSNTRPTETTTLNPNENISFPYKICYETTSELVTRFELENVTQMYPKTLIGEMKQLSYDAGNSLEDGTNTWLKANGQAINSNDYPELYEKFNTSRTDDDIEVSIPSLSNEVGYYYICAK